MERLPSPSDKDNKTVKKIRSLFQGRKLVIATMHGKEKVMAPLVSRHLFVLPHVAPINTDAFGTFSGEVERVNDSFTTLRRKISHALKITGETLGMGSEGSFGPHPSLPWVTADHELVMLLDVQNHGEWYASAISTETNFTQTTVSDAKALQAFAEAVHFPEHALMVRQADGKLVKGINDWTILKNTVDPLFRKGESVAIETDMRAHHNPMRMRVIEQTTRTLIDKIYSLCPRCDSPGFSIASRAEGLSCEQCGAPTRLIKTEIWVCTACRYTENHPVTARTASAMYCDFCNP
jgi:hypothetical protein